jgi:type IV pilus assembly protein PilQ
MRFKRLLTVGLMALFCAGTATAASQLNSVQVEAAPNGMTVNLRTTGSFAHKEYRADQHLMLVDLAGVTADAAVQRTAALSSAILKGYKLSSYTSASGSEVTRIELQLGDDVSVDVQDQSDGLQVLLKSGVKPVLAPSATSSTGKVAGSSAASPALPAYAKPVVKDSYKVTAMSPAAKPAAAPAVNSPAAQPKSQPRVMASKTAPAAIRNVSVRHGNGTLDVIIDGPSEARPFLLKQPDRLVLDFSNVVAKTAIKKIAVNSKDVLQVRVGRFQAEPPVTRVVIDLSGPREFDLVPSAKQVIVRIKTEETAALPPSAPAPAPASTEVAESAAPASPVVSNMQSDREAHVVPAVAVTPVAARPVLVVERANPVVEPAPAVAHPAPVVAPPAPVKAAVVVEAAAAPAPQSTPAVREPQVPDAKEHDSRAAEVIAVSPQSSQPVVEMARATPPVAERQVPVTSTTTSAIAPAPKYTGEPISVNLKDVDLKDFFRLIHEISGLNIVLDPNVKGNLTLVLDDVPWDQALDIVLKNNALDRELQGNVLRIAATDTLRREAVDRRAQSEAVALAVDRQTITRFLSYAKAKELVPTVKKFLTARGDVIADERTNTLIISDIPSVLPNLDRLISQLDRKSREVEIEVRVVSATRSFSRDLGVQLGFNWLNGVSTIGGLSSLTQTTTTNSVTGGTSTVNTNPGTVPLFNNLPVTNPTTGFTISNITKSYGIDAVLTAAESHNLAKILSRPRVVTQSNVKAEVKQGVKLPVYQASTANANATVSYIDAVLRLSVTPQITSDNTIFLTVDVENTQPSGQTNGNYILTTQQATTQVLVTDGGTVVIGGVIQTTNTVSTSQTPLLGDIPWLGSLFRQRSVKTETDELIFFITPKIIET